MWQAFYKQIYAIEKLGQVKMKKKINSWQNFNSTRTINAETGDPKSLNKTKGVIHKGSSFTGQPPQRISLKGGGTSGCRANGGGPWHRSRSVSEAPWRPRDSVVIISSILRSTISCFVQNGSTRPPLREREVRRDVPVPNCCLGKLTRHTTTFQINKSVIY